jgi:hypothetical protein
MPLAKGTVEPGAALSNSFRLEIPILGTVYFTKVGALEQELKTAVLPDSTAQTTGKVDPVEFDAEQMAHHGTEILALEAWFAACKVGAPLHKQIGTLHMLGADGEPVRSYLLDGLILKGRTIPELDASGDGEGVRFGWKLVVDNVVPLG